MAVKHMNRVFMLPLPSSVRFVLLALARYADDKDYCYPGIVKLSEMTGYCEKTVVRSIRVLSRLGIIDVKKNPNGNNHTYTLFVTGDIKAWDQYLKSKAQILRDMNNENQSSSITPKSIYKYSINNEIEEGENKKVGMTCDSSHVIQIPQNLKTILEGDLLEIPPGRRKSMLQKVWEETIPKYFKGLKVEVKPDDKWAIDKIYNDYKKELPIYEFIEYIIVNWSIFANRAKKNFEDSHAKAFPNIPNFPYLLFYMELAVYMFWDSRKEV